MKNIFSALILILAVACASKPIEEKPAVIANESAAAPIAETETSIANDPLFKAVSAAIETRDQKMLRKVLKNISKKPEFRKSEENDILNAGLYLATLDGLKCETIIIHILEKIYQARVLKLKAVHFISVDKNHESSPLCRDVIANSLPRMNDPAVVLNEVSEYYVKLITDDSEKQIEKKAASYNRLLTTASYMIKEACKKSESDSVCQLKPTFQAFANQSKNSKTRAVKRNAGAVLDILK